MIAELLEPRRLLSVTISNAKLDYNSEPNAFTFDLSAPLATNLTASKFSFDNLSTHQPIPSSKLTVTTSSDGLHVRVAVHDLTSASNVSLSTVGKADVLPNGWFELSLSHFEVPGMTNDWSMQDFYMVGDTPDFSGVRDGIVNADDAARLDAGYQSQGNANPVIDYSHGDLNYDGVINADDYGVMDAAFQSGVLSPAPLPPTTIHVLRAPADTGQNISWNADAVTGETG